MPHRSRGEIVIFVIFERFWAVRHRGIAHFIAICQCGNDPEMPFIVSDQFHSNGGGLIRSESKFMADYGFWRC